MSEIKDTFSSSKDNKSLSLIKLNITECKNTLIYEDNCEIKPYNNSVEVSFVVSGKGIHRILNETTECQVGDIYIVNSSVSRGYYAIDDNNFPTIFTVRFDPKTLLSDCYADSLSPNFCYGIFRDNIPISYALLNSSSLDIIIRLFNQLKEELENNKHENLEAQRSYLILLLINIARYINLADTVVPNSSKEWALISVAIREIHSRSGDVNMTLQSIASSLFVSKSHLSRLFQKVVGESFVDYTRKVRIDKACNFLENSSLTNEEIIRKCGLKDIPTFYRQFKAEKGMTPHKYRLSHNRLCNNDYVNDEILYDISETLKNGRYSNIKDLVETAINSGISANIILEQGLTKGMNTVAEKFKNNEVFVPSVLVSAKAMNIGIETLKPYLIDNENYSIGNVCIGTVRGDLHDIGKNLVKILMQSKGLNVIDLGVDVTPEEFIETAIEHNCKVICCSALLTTTMGVMREIVDLAAQKGIRSKVKILIGGAPVTKEFCDNIGADIYTTDAASAAEAALQFCRCFK